MQRVHHTYAIAVLLFGFTLLTAVSVGLWRTCVCVAKDEDDRSEYTAVAMVRSSHLHSTDLVLS